MSGGRHWIDKTVISILFLLLFVKQSRIKTIILREAWTKTENSLLLLWREIKTQTFCAANFIERRSFVNHRPSITLKAKERTPKTWDSRDCFLTSLFFYFFKPHLHDCILTFLSFFITFNFLVFFFFFFTSSFVDLNNNNHPKKSQSRYVIID